MPEDTLRGLDSSLLLSGRKAFWNLPWAQLSAFETGGEGKETTPPDPSALSAQGLGGGAQEEEEPRERKEPPQSRTHLLFQLPGLLSAEQHLVPGLLVGVCHQRVSVVRPQLRKEQLSGRAGPGHVWGRAGAARGQRGSCPGGGWAGSSPSPAAWSSASYSSGFCESPLPCPWRVLAGCAQQAGSWGGCSWDNTTQVRSPRKFL